MGNGEKKKDRTNEEQNRETQKQKVWKGATRSRENNRRTLETDCTAEVAKQ